MDTLSKSNHVSPVCDVACAEGRSPVLTIVYIVLWLLLPRSWYHLLSCFHVFWCQVSGLAIIVLLVSIFIVCSSMWHTTTTHPASTWVRTEGSMIFTLAWDWPSAPASSLEAVLSSRKKDFWGWRGRGRCEQVLTALFWVSTAHYNKAPRQSDELRHSQVLLCNTENQLRRQTSKHTY